MLTAYIDESYTSDYYYIGAVVIDSGDAHMLDAALARVMAYASTFGVDPSVELHAHRLMVGRSGWEPVAGKFRASTAIYRRALRELAALPVRMVIRGVDVVRLNNRYSYPYPPHQVALQHVLEDVDEYAESFGLTAHVLADKIDDQEAHRSKVDSYRRVGTGGYRPRKLESIELPITFADSHQVAGLQFADIVAYLYRRHMAHEETNPKTAAVVQSLWAELRPIRGTVWTWRP